MSKKKYVSLTAFFAIVIGASVSVAAPFKIFMISSTAVDHLASSAMARAVLPQMGMTNDFTVDATTDNTLINEANLAKYDVFLQMHRAPFEIKVEQRAALENFVKSGKGWVGVHAAGLIIPSVYTSSNLPDWPFFNDLIGGVTWVTHPMLQMGTVVIEDRTHPATKNMPAMFRILDEWYEFSGNPRGRVRILGNADESTYKQVKPQGDHPMIWTQEKYPRAIYIATGHDASDWQNVAFTTLIRDSLLWAAGRLGTPADDGGTDGGADATSDSAADGPVVAEVAVGTGGAPGGGSGGATTDAATGGGAGGSVGSGGATVPASGGATGSGSTSSGGCSYATGGLSTDGAGALLPLLLLAGGMALVRHRQRNL
jgi:type 1 glutamine amidotransferase